MANQAIKPNALQPATTIRRFINLVIDLILYELVMIFMVYPVTYLLFGRGLLENYWASLLYGLFFQFLYYFTFESVLQKTPGKFITGTKVTMDDGSKPEPASIAKRTLIRFVPFDAISIYTGDSSEKKGTWWHDRWSSTRVVTA